MMMSKRQELERMIEEAKWRYVSAQFTIDDAFEWLHIYKRLKQELEQTEVE